MQKREPNQSKHSKAKNKNLESIIAIYFDFMILIIRMWMKLSQKYDETVLLKGR